MRRIRQIEPSVLRISTGYETVATLNVKGEELRSHGIEFSVALDSDEEPFIEAGPIKEAFVEASTGEQALLIWPDTNEPDPPYLDVRAPLSVTADPAGFAATIAGALGLPDDRCTWVVSREEWSEWRERYAALG